MLVILKNLFFSLIKKTLFRYSFGTQFQFRILSHIFLGFFVLSTLMVFFIYTQAKKQSEREIEEFRKNVFMSYDESIKFQVQSVHSILRVFDNKVKNGEMSLTQAQLESKNLIRNMRYMDDGSGYFWIDKTDGINVLHSLTPFVEGTNRIKAMKEESNIIQRGILVGMQPGGGFLEYSWPKEAFGQDYRKRSFLQEFKPWGWVVGTGHYIDVMNTVIIEHDKASRQNAFLSIVWFSFFGLAVFIFIVGGTFFVVKKEIQKLGGDPELDVLTGIKNRMKIMYCLEEQKTQLWSQSSCLSVGIMDIDFFKKINDTFGHQVGDDVLRHVASICSEHIRNNDFLGRYGGEEFLFVFPNTTEKQAFLLAERLREKIQSTPFKASNKEVIPITVSIGLSSWYFNEEYIEVSVEKMIEKADNALYLAKEKGRNKVIGDWNIKSFL